MKRRPRRYPMFVQMLFWCWITIALPAAAMIAVELLINQPPPALASRFLMEKALQDESVRVQEIWLRSGNAALDQELKEFQQQSHVEAFFVNPVTGKDVRGTQVPEPLINLSREAGLGTSARWSVAGLWLQTAIPTNRGQIFVAHFERDATVLRPFSRGLRFIVAIFTAGLVCWLTARRFNRRIDALREATQQLSRGNLSARANLTDEWRSQELVALAGDFNAMAVQIETLVNAQKRLVGDVSHELRSPLTRLKIALALANRDTDRPQQLGNHLERIGLETGQLEILIDELLLLSRIENHLDAQPPTRFNWSETIASCVTDLRWESQNHADPVEIHFEAPIEPIWIIGDPTHLRRALENVGRNALNYSPSKGRITIKLHKEGNQLRTWVRDRGPGIPEAELESVFQPFYRVDTARERAADGVTGTGLGLAIAQRAVEASGGNILARNRLGGGLEIEISLPCAQI